MLQWARERSFPDIVYAAEKLNVTVERLRAWEDEDEVARPTFHQAQDLAKKLKIPFGYLYLSNPPDERLPLPDLRVRSGTPPRKPSPDFLEVLYDAFRKQDWYREYLTNERMGPLPFTNRFTINSPTKDIADDIRATLQLNDDFRRSVSDRDGFFRQFVRHAEDAGVLVMCSGIVGSNTHRSLDPDEFQGFAMSDAIAPLVFVNQNDFKSAQIFTLAHELAHIWMGISGVSSIEYFAKPAEQLHGWERKADAVAAETLVPADTFELRWNDLTNVDENLHRLSTYYRVSLFVILRRAYELNKISLEAFRAKYTELRAKIHGKQKGGGGGYASILSRNSRTITTALVYSVVEGKASVKEASTLLNTRISKLQSLAKYIQETKYA